MKKYYKRTIEKKKSKISPRTLVSLVVLLILCIVRLAVIPYAETQMALPEPKTEFSGLLDFWWWPKMTKRNKIGSSAK